MDIDIPDIDPPPPRPEHNERYDVERVVNASTGDVLFSSCKHEALSTPIPFTPNFTAVGFEHWTYEGKVHIDGCGFHGCVKWSGRLDNFAALWVGFQVTDGVCDGGYKCSVPVGGGRDGYGSISLRIR